VVGRLSEIGQLCPIGNPPDFGAECLCLRNSNWIIPATEATDEIIFAVNLYPHLDGTIIVS